MNMNEQRIVGPHPSSETLAGYACEPQSNRYADIARHIASCIRCQKEISGMGRLVAGLREVGTIQATNESPSEQHLSAHDIEQLVHAVEGAQLPTLRQHAEHCGECRRKLLLHRARLASRSSSAPQDKTEPKQAKVISLPQWWQRSIPMWGAVPLSMAAGLLMAVGLQIGGPGLPSAPTIAMYQEDPRMVYTPPSGQPGIGFFSDAAQRAEAYPGLSARVRNQQAHFTWLAVPEAIDYQLRVVSYSAEGSKVVFQQRSPLTELSFDASLFVAGVRYDWELSGARRDGVNFIARGGFVVAQ